MTTSNPIIQEVRATREALAARFNFDLHRIFADAVKRQSAQASGKRPRTPGHGADGQPATRPKSK